MRKNALKIPPKYARPKIELKAPRPRDGDPVNEVGLNAWQVELRDRMIPAILALAEKYGADPQELWKVAPLLLDFVAKDSRGRPRKVTSEVMGRVAAAVKRGASKPAAAELGGVSVRTIQRERTRQKK